MKVGIILFFGFLFSPLLFFGQNARGSEGEDISDASEGNKLALIVGISDYNEPKLKLNYAHSDALLFKEYLEKIEKVDQKNISLLVNKEAVSLSIMRSLKKLMTDSKKGDLVYIYFAGHGDVVDDFGEEEGFLLAADANQNQEYFGTGGVLDLKTLNNVITKITDKGAKVVLVLDACHSGFIFKEGTQKNLQTINNNFQNSTKFLSCKPDQVSYESAELKHGSFT